MGPPAVIQVGDCLSLRLITNAGVQAKDLMARNPTYGLTTTISPPFPTSTSVLNYFKHNFFC